MTKPKHTCPECLRSFTYPPQRAGNAVACPACKKPIRLPRIIEDAPQITPSSNAQSNHELSTQLPQTRPCPFCAETILKAASKCKHCGEHLKLANESLPANQTVGTAGIIAAIVGCMILFASFIMDTTVRSSTGDRIYNIGLQQQQMMGVLLGLAICVTGTLVAIFTLKNGSKIVSGNLDRGLVSKTPDDSSIRKLSFSVDKPTLVFLAKNQKYLIWTLVSQVLAIIFFLAIPEIGVFFFVAMIIGQLLVVLRVAIACYPRPIGLLIGLSSFIPYMGFAVILVINVRATTILKEAGVMVGPLGVSKDEIIRLEYERALSD